jgi:hypothetical protein
MRLIKAQTTNLRSITGKGVKYDIDNQVIVDSNNVMLIPKGAESERPVNPVSGHMRFNTDDGQFEVYQDNVWRELRFKEPNRDPGIVVQYLGDGDAVETIFGPLDSGDTDYPAPSTSQSVIVYVENVFQVPGPLLDGNSVEIHNYTLEENVSGSVDNSKSDGWYLVFESPPDADRPLIAIHNFDK